MGNSFFRFKKFLIHQQKSAMKVCTDSCLFGSLLPFDDGMLHVLDIGTGTGLLSLMYAQKNITAQIDAVEINADAALEAGDNFSESIYKDRLQIICTNITDFAKKKSTAYDLIFSNPPFYKKDLKTGNESKDIAHHGNMLTLQELAQAINLLLAKDGIACLLLPYHRKTESKTLFLNYQLHCYKEIHVKQTPRHQPFRVIQFFSGKIRTTITQEIIIKNTDDSYTDDFTRLLKDYYLYL